MSNMAAAFAFFAALSLPAGRICLLLALAVALSTRDGRGRLARAMKSPAFLGWAAFFLLALVVSAFAASTNTDPLLNPVHGIRKLVKLAWMAGTLGIAAEATRQSGSALRIIRAFAVGAALCGLWIALIHPAEAWLESSFPDRATLAASVEDPTVLTSREAYLVHLGEKLGLLDSKRYAALKPKHKSFKDFQAARDALNAQPLLRFVHSSGWKASTFGDALAKRGTMADAQRLMIGTLAALVLWISAIRRKDRRDAIFSIAVGALSFAGLLATCKRGPLAVCAISAATTLLAAGFSARRALAAIIAVVLIALAVPQVRARFARIPSEFSLDKGGRARMWLVIAPELHREKPFGIGFRALTYAKMVDVDRKTSQGEVHVEVGRTHVHCTPLQTWVDFGWPGPAIWAAWMLASIAFAFRASRGKGADSAMLAAPAFLLALVLYSLVEYNLADSEIVLLYTLGFGLTTRPA